MAGPESREPQPGPEVSAARPSPLRLPVRCAAIAWAAGLASLGLAWVQHLWQVPHPHPLPLVLLLGAMTLAAVAALGSGLRLAATGPRRLPALLWAAIALLPPLAWASVGLYAQRSGGSGGCPTTCRWAWPRSWASPSCGWRRPTSTRTGWRRRGW